MINMEKPRGNAVQVSTHDGAFSCYHIAPDGGELRGGLVLLQEIFGTNLHIRQLADQWATAGFEVLVPDLFWRSDPGVELGYEGADLDRAREMYSELDWDKAVDDVKICAERLRGKYLGRVMVVGYCFGGKLATICATQGWVDRAIGYYGVGIEKLGIAHDVKCPIMLHFGERDAGTPPAAIAKLVSQLPDTAQVFSYEGAGHGFNNWNKSAHDAPAAQRAFARSLAFLVS